MRSPLLATVVKLNILAAVAVVVPIVPKSKTTVEAIEGIAIPTRAREDTAGLVILIMNIY
jgi:hypothetical protein